MGWLADLRSLLTTDGDLITRTSGVPARVTRASLAADAAFTAAFRSDAFPVFIGANAIWLGEGSPSQGNQGATSGSRKAAWSLDATAYEAIMATIQVPANWATVDVHVVWTNPASSTGNVRFRLYTQEFSDTDSTNAGTSNGDVDAAAPAQFVTQVTTLAVGVAVNGGPGEYLSLWLQRRGGDAADTLANDAAVLGFEVRKAS